jgi:hypothetical protein
VHFFARTTGKQDGQMLVGQGVTLNRKRMLDVMNHVERGLAASMLATE